MNFDISYILDEAGAQERALLDRLGERPISILDFRDPLDTTDTPAFVLALATGQPIFLPAGRGLGAGGVYLIDTPADSGKAGYLVSGTVIFGDGMGKTVIRPADPDVTVFRQFSSDAGTTQDDIVLRDLTLYGWNVEDGFSEHVHLAAFSGTRNLLVERVEFKGFRGDGLYIGSGESGSDERHNYNFTVRDCVFDGINHENRQGISIIDGDGGLIENCLFTQVTKSTMPGAIDMEPNASFSVIRNITVRKCVFDDVGGNVGAVAVIIVPEAPVARNIQILGNHFLGCASNDIGINMLRLLGATDEDSAILIDGNYGNGAGVTGSRPLALASARGVVITGSNKWVDYDNPVLFGFNGTSELVRDIVCSAELTQVGTATGQPGLLICKAIGVRIEGMRFDRCGFPGSAGCAIMFLSDVTSDYIRIENIRVVPNTSQTIAIDNLSGTHTFTPAHNRAIDNDLGGLASEFQATGPGQLLTASTTFDPNNLADGAGQTSGAITVTGAAFGDDVAVAPPYDLQGIVCTGYVSAADNVKIRLQNETGGAIDLASGTWKVVVQKALA
ncbi:MAG TPA: hypothetical protein VEX35_03490 [Allosphingosinicella sp.]|nr:hypothetical protein [Allosphingosinicella sp.]